MVTPRSLRPPEPHPIPLGSLFPGTDRPDVGVSGITLDSRLVQPGDLYVALPGRSTHGARFAAAAVDAGAAAVLTDAEGAALAAGLPAAVVVVADPRRAMAGAAADIFGRPSERLTMLAVTGTNGKTTTSYLLEAALRAAGRRPGLIGTIGFRLDGQALESARTTITTPESPELQALLATMREGGADSVVMEVSSHAVVLGRADAITFDVAGFTNFGRDHLDFHGTEEAYFEAKAELFTAARTRHAVVNIDDPRGRQLADRVRAGAAVRLTTTSLAPGADFFPDRIEPQTDGSSRLVLTTPLGQLDLVLGLPGEFNIANAVTAVAMLAAVDVDLDRAVTGLAAAQVPGRMQRVDLGPEAPTVIVDFAHTPQAVGSVLSSLAGRRCIVVLGAGGDRDVQKRGPIGAAAARGAAVVIVTDDNPRTEEPAAIRARVLEGAREVATSLTGGVEVLDGGDRRSAIRLALQRAGVHDVVAILGKGHEEGQEVSGTVHPFSDSAVVEQEWNVLNGGAA
ncbi:UDP-N-acetylmuramoyl-L-alanyl-D-glutamate--2,6-diaminopimelate ligase [Microlunatus panaciterrae]|uniref:UDP-N-acetylmuramoyl-L-alanyl-D-glutamate--2,6-diaminopimelate ligase n=1 Tax=Microlunatus panaciterrae TaxID=400768 RepID=A0ABS2RMG6_9ACTN|nr:UDP-N-acetylmuramoyl-L-alanyl-D-glutamate--2,6-diaminopimelate ligase [Microlunatus panaciterrae]MBM7800201.1 UDP-N-acetylmuramoyl-L-alanyl-D-glutamate--2,6-diaminopimelate ligase [Microlunatus panaciterrae]